MKVNAQLMRILKEEIEALDYGKVTVSINVAGPYVEIASEKKIRIVKTENDEGNSGTVPYHKG